MEWDSQRRSFVYVE